MNSLSGRPPVHALWQLIRVKVNALFVPMLRLNILHPLENGFCIFEYGQKCLRGADTHTHHQQYQIKLSAGVLLGSVVGKRSICFNLCSIIYTLK